jgi:hypothetical protein
MTDTIPGTAYRIPGPWDLLQMGPGITSRNWLLATYGPEAVTAWLAAGRPHPTPEPTPRADLGVIRRGWRGDYRRRY